MSKKELKINGKYIDSVLIALALSFLVMFIIEHFSKFSYIPNVPTTYTNGKVNNTTSFYPATTPIALLYQDTPFGTTINLPTKGMMSSELAFSDTEFKSYSNKAGLYINAILVDFKYLLMIWAALSMILIFFNTYKLKITP